MWTIYFGTCALNVCLSWLSPPPDRYLVFSVMKCLQAVNSLEHCLIGRLFVASRILLITSIHHLGINTMYFTKIFTRKVFFKSFCVFVSLSFFFFLQRNACPLKIETNNIKKMQLMKKIILFSLTVKAFLKSPLNLQSLLPELWRFLDLSVEVCAMFEVNLKMFTNFFRVLEWNV